MSFAAARSSCWRRLSDPVHALGGYLDLDRLRPQRFGGETGGRLRHARDLARSSLAIRHPFTLQYAREVVDAETAACPGFLTANYVITGAWALAFLLMLMANVLMIYLPGMPLWSGLAIAFAARNTALYFTRWYPEIPAREIRKRRTAFCPVREHHFETQAKPPFDEAQEPER